MTIVLNSTTGITTPPVSVQGATSGSITFAAPDVAGTNTQTLVAATGTLAPLIASTAVASTSGTSIDFTGIPSWVKRITVMFNGVSSSGTSSFLIQLGSGSITNTGYISTSILANTSNTTIGVSSTAGMAMFTNGAADIKSGSMVLHLISGNIWVSNHTAKALATASIFGGGDVTLSGVLDRVRITTVNGTDTFDAGSINILYE